MYVVWGFGVENTYWIKFTFVKTQFYFTNIVDPDLVKFYPVLYRLGLTSQFYCIQLYIIPNGVNVLCPRVSIVFEDHIKDKRVTHFVLLVIDGVK